MIEKAFGQTEFPRHLLYSINARIGGYGLDLNAAEGIQLAYRNNFLGLALGYANRQAVVPARLVRSLAWSPVRLLSFLSSPFYYDAKKRYVDRIATRELTSGRYDFFHGWAGNSFKSLREANRLNIPSVIEIPTWHRDKGKIKAREKVEVSRHQKEARFPDSLFTGLLVTRQESLEEYDRADVLLVPSECSARTFTTAGISREKIVMLGAGVDVSLFEANPPERIPASFSAERPMQAIYCGAVIKRKGAHRLLEAWHRLALPHARLTLVGKVHPEIEPFLKEFGGRSINAMGFSNRVHDLLKEADVHIFPSECEGSAKTVYEACAAGLAQITTFESGDVVQDGENGLIVPANDTTALATAIQRVYREPSLLREFSARARAKAERELTWDHFRERLAGGYRLAMERRRQTAAR
jgi:glycosyltransferase involved in cell wall biosynthesis